MGKKIRKISSFWAGFAILYKALFLIKTEEISIFFLAVKKKPVQRVMARTVQLLIGMTRTVPLNCPI